MNQLSNSLGGHEEDITISSFGQCSRIAVDYVGNLEESEEKETTYKNFNISCNESTLESDKTEKLEAQQLTIFTLQV